VESALTPADMAEIHSALRYRSDDISAPIWNA